MSFRCASKKYGIRNYDSTIKAHKDYAQTACPGDKLYAKLANISDRVETLKPTKLNINLVTG